MDIDQQRGQTTEELEADMIFMQNVAIDAGGTLRHVRNGGHSSTINPIMNTAPSDQFGGMLVHELITERSWHGISYHAVFTFSADADIEHLLARLKEQLTQRGYLFGTVGKVS
jgi:hypothetical protein